MSDELQNQEPKKFKLGRLHINSIFLLIMIFSLFSVIILAVFVWLAS